MLCCSGGLQTVEALGVAAKECGFAGWFFDRRSENAATTHSSNEAIGIDEILVRMKKANPHLMSN